MGIRTETEKVEIFIGAKVKVEFEKDGQKVSFAGKVIDKDIRPNVWKVKRDNSQQEYYVPERFFRKI